MPFQRDIATVRENMVQRESTPGALGNEIDGDEELAIFFFNNSIFIYSQLISIRECMCVRSLLSLYFKRTETYTQYQHTYSLSKNIFR